MRHHQLLDCGQLRGIERWLMSDRRGQRARRHPASPVSVFTAQFISAELCLNGRSAMAGRDCFPLGRLIGPGVLQWVSAAAPNFDDA
ncbi:hypothetical protein JOF56_009573 [Kibdelosporangium banguiense]|uniref:Uncharacterized protein n=1 Tax=Kibdelosporangium banguiense TaxID=1365924 RepID=A0ABS4TXT6_9PSEU|nr:hypothetical protein [Kibdelosporangium banguiense]MBP2329188.1 hypothetical protein [Kibdelosporangium banguiense]